MDTARHREELTEVPAEEQVEITEELNGLTLEMRVEDDDARFRPLPSSDTPQDVKEKQMLAASRVLPRGSSPSGSPNHASPRGSPQRSREASPVDVDDIDVNDLISEGFTDNMTDSMTVYTAQTASEDNANQGERASHGVMHWVKSTDTVVGLAFKYGVTVRFFDGRTNDCRLRAFVA
jgi:hypothetical protein